jgi:hypothetical protein
MMHAPPRIGKARFDHMCSTRTCFEDRLEEYANVTIPSLYLPDYIEHEDEAVQNDWSSFGAQAVNHLANRIMRTMFRPGFPFFRIDPGKKAKEELAAAGIQDSQLRESMVAVEAEAISLFEQMAIRRVVFQAMKNLIVLGNGLLIEEKKGLRFVGIRDYAVRRSISGREVEIAVREHVLFDELEEEVQMALPKRAHEGQEHYVDFVQHYLRKGDRWEMRQYVDDTDLGDEFASHWSVDKFPLHVLAWDLSYRSDYGAGLVEQNFGDFASLSSLAESEVKAAVLASDYRWVLDPNATSNLQDMKASRTGDVLSGRANDLTLVSLAGNGAALQAINASLQAVVRRIGQAFLMQSASTRDSERTTAAEIRLNADELETSLGGGYTHLSQMLQRPIAIYLLRQAGYDPTGSGFDVKIVVGVEAMSRTQDGQLILAALSDAATASQIDDVTRSRLRMGEVLSSIFASYGIAASRYVLTDEEFQQQQQAAAQAQQAQEAAQAGVQAGADIAVNESQRPQ